MGIGGGGSLKGTKKQLKHQSICAAPIVRWGSFPKRLLSVFLLLWPQSFKFIRFKVNGCNGLGFWDAQTALGNGDLFFF